MQMLISISVSVGLFLLGCVLMVQYIRRTFNVFFTALAETEDNRLAELTRRVVRLEAMMVKDFITGGPISTAVLEDVDMEEKNAS